jgi:Mechanosensitive ion channel, conserved TM helix
MDTTLDQISQVIASYVPNLLGALAILVVGWLVARIVAALIRSGLHRTSFDNRIAAWIFRDKASEALPVEQWIAKAVFYVLMIFVLIGFFQALGLTLPTEPLNRLLTDVFRFAPQIVAACLLLLIAWLLARVLRAIVARVLTAARIDERLASRVGGDQETNISLTQTFADTVYWLVFLLFLPAVLNALALQGLLLPVQAMLTKILDYLPNLFSAGLILAIGWLLARIIQGITSNLLASVGVDRLSERAGLSAVMGQQRLSAVIGLIVYVVILIPVLIAVLDALALNAITQPASNMLNSILAALPALFAACLILIVAYVVGRIVSGLTTNLLTGIGFNAVLTNIGLRAPSAPGDRTPSEVAGNLVLVAIMLFAAIESVRELGFDVLADLITRFTVFAGEIVLGLVIFGIGLYLANLASRTILTSSAAQSWLLALAARVSIIILAGAMALRQMGLASDIINLAFGLLLGSVAVAVALAFGLGARDIAGRELADWIQSLRSRGSQRG